MFNRFESDSLDFDKGFERHCEYLSKVHSLALELWNESSIRTKLDYIKDSYIEYFKEPERAFKRLSKLKINDFRDLIESPESSEILIDYLEDIIKESLQDY